MKFGTWVEIEVMGVNCPLAKEFEDDFFFMRHGKKVVDHGRYFLDFRNKKVRDFADEVMDRIIRDFSLEYIKMDFNVDEGSGTEVNSSSFGDGLLQANIAFLDWVKAVQERHPNVILKNSASGALRTDYATMAVYPLVSYSDQTDTYHVSQISAASGAALITERAAAWVFPPQDADEDRMVFNAVNGMLSRMILSGGIGWFENESQISIMKNAVQIYKEIRTEIPDSIPFFPFGIETYGKKALCTGIKGKNRTFITVWNKENCVQNIEVKLDCKSSSILFASHDTSVKTTENGISVHFERGMSAAVIELK